MLVGPSCKQRLTNFQDMFFQCTQTVLFSGSVLLVLPFALGLFQKLKYLKSARVEKFVNFRLFKIYPDAF